MFDKLKIDDPVGAISVHGVCGIWGTLAVGILSTQANFGVQLLGTVAILTTSFIFSLLVFGALKYTLVSGYPEKWNLTDLRLKEIPDFRRWISMPITNLTLA